MQVRVGIAPSLRSRVVGHLGPSLMPRTTLNTKEMNVLLTVGTLEISRIVDL